MGCLHLINLLHQNLLNILLTRMFLQELKVMMIIGDKNLLSILLQTRMLLKELQVLMIMGYKNLLSILHQTMMLLKELKVMMVEHSSLPQVPYLKQTKHANLEIIKCQHLFCILFFLKVLKVVPVKQGLETYEGVDDLNYLQMRMNHLFVACNNLYSTYYLLMKMSAPNL